MKHSVLTISLISAIYVIIRLDNRKNIANDCTAITCTMSIQKYILQVAVE